jgi:3-hydroxy-3-methylglutaryl CoA synthase
MAIKFELRVSGEIQGVFESLQDAQRIGLPHGKQGRQVLVSSYGEGAPSQFWYFDMTINSWVYGQPDWA